MIFYRRDQTYLFCRLFQRHGSVAPASLLVSLPCSVLTALLRYCIDEGYLPSLDTDDQRSVIKESSIWSGFVFLVGFLIVFRTSQAYTRYWDGSSALHRMRVEWHDACASLIAFSKFSGDNEENSEIFQHTLVRLFSLLHGVALAEVEDTPDDSEVAQAFKYELVDPGGLDQTTLRTVKSCHMKVELVYQWIQQLIVENVDRGVLRAPAPCLTIPLQQLNQGMVAYRDSRKISQIPFPFPYAQVCEWLLVLHWLTTPLVVSQYSTTPWWAALFCFLQVFVYWALNAIAIEVENPFGMDANDVDASALQAEMNDHLLQLMHKGTKRTPSLAPAEHHGGSHWRGGDIRKQTTCLADAWNLLPPEDEFVPRTSQQSSAQSFGMTNSWQRRGSSAQSFSMSPMTPTSIQQQRRGSVLSVLSRQKAKRPPQVSVLHFERPAQTTQQIDAQISLLSEAAFSKRESSVLSPASHARQDSTGWESTCTSQKSIPGVGNAFDSTLPLTPTAGPLGLDALAEEDSQSITPQTPVGQRDVSLVCSGPKGEMSRQIECRASEKSDVSSFRASSPQSDSSTSAKNVEVGHSASILAVSVAELPELSRIPPPRKPTRENSRPLEWLSIAEDADEDE